MLKKTSIVLSTFFVVLFFPLIVNADIIHLGPANFQCYDPDEGNTYYHAYNDYLYCESGSSYRQFCSNCIELPHLSYLDQVRIYYKDNYSGYLRVRVYRTKVSDMTEEILAEFISSGEASFDRTEDLETFTYPTVKAKGYRYFINVYISSSSAAGNIMFKGVRVRYYPPTS